MRYISMFVIALVIGLGLVVLSTAQVKAQVDGCLLLIEKSADPADDTVFGFSNSADDSEFGLSDPDNPTTFEVIEIGVPTTITELPIDGWKLDGIECVNGTNDCGPGTFIPCLDIIVDEDTNSIIAVCLDNDEGSCTFTNVRAPIDVPSLSQYGLIVMALILGVVAFIIFRRRKTTA